MDVTNVSQSFGTASESPDMITLNDRLPLETRSSRRRLVRGPYARRPRHGCGLLHPVCEPVVVVLHAGFFVAEAGLFEAA
jgi:hypothetical protein